MDELLETFGQVRKMATGANLDISFPSIHQSCGSESEFDGIVSRFYVFFNEDLARDANFLSPHVKSSKIQACRGILHCLRTSAQHGNSKFKNNALQWKNKHGTPQKCADALSRILQDALEEMVRAAFVVASDPLKTEEWRAIVSLDVGAIFDSAAQNLGLNFSVGKRGYMLRQVIGRLKIVSSYSKYELLVADYCVQEMVSQRQPLPVPYEKVLDFLGLLGDRGASVAILIAHSVAAAGPQLEEETFLARVEAAWRAAVDY